MHVWPLPRLADGRGPVVTQSYHSPSHLGVDLMYPWAAGDPLARPWAAVDRKGRPRYSIPRGDIPILAYAAGRVLYARRAANGWRTRVRADGHGGEALDYLDLHMSEVRVAAGELVEAGQVLGVCGVDYVAHDHHEHRVVVADGQRDGWGRVAVDPEPALALALIRGLP